MANIKVKRDDAPVVLDACVLVNFKVCDLLLTLAERNAYVPAWSPEILDEVYRTLTRKLNWKTSVADSWQAAVRTTFPGASISGFDHLIPACANHPKDRHVLAAAIKSKAEIIVTFNLRDFPLASLRPWNISAVHPDLFLQTLLRQFPEAVFGALTEMATSADMTIGAVLSNLQNLLPEFVQEATKL